MLETISKCHVQKAAGPDQRATPASRLSSFEYRYLTEFQSHEPEFDYLKSLEIEEKINKVKWCRTSCGSRMLLSTNDKTIKLWRVNLEAEALCILHLCIVCVVSQVSNHKQIIKLSALQVGDRKVCSLANFNFGDGSHNGWSIAAGYEPLPCDLVDATHKCNIVLCTTAGKLQSYLY
jgi:hypothetical protein